MVARFARSQLIPTAAVSAVGRATKLTVLAGLALFAFPPTFIAYGPSLDPGWVYAINRAAADGLRFGRDIAFTYGPLGFVSCPMDVGQNLLIATAFRVALFAVWLTAVAFLTWKQAVWRVALFAAGAALAAAPVHPDAYNLDRVGMLLSVVVYLLIAAVATASRWPAGVAAVVAGTAVLIKANVGLACLGALMGYCLSELLGRGRAGFRRAAAPAGVFALTVGLLWLGFGGSVGAAVDHFRASALIAEGYSSHMAYHDESYGWRPDRGLIVAIAASVGVAVGCVAWSQPGLRADALILAFPLFTLYKSAVVRCDHGHWRPALFHAVALLSVFVLRGRSGPALVAWLFVAVGATGMLADAFQRQHLADRLGWGVRSARQLMEWSATRAKLADAERVPTAANIADFPYPPPGGLGSEFRPEVPVRPWLASLDRVAKTDIHPWDLLIARDAGLNWTPRFVPQSYSAYHPKLDDASAETYRRADGPATVVYHHTAIDLYHPFTVDPLTVTELVRWYEVDRRLDPEHLLLRRRASAGLGDPVPVASGTVRPGEPLAVPPAAPGEVVFLALDYKLTASGRVANFAYRIEPPLLTIRYVDGTTTDVAVGWRNAASGFLLSPLPTGLDAAQAFLAGGDGPRVASVTLHPNSAFAPAVAYEWRKATRK